MIKLDLAKKSWWDSIVGDSTKITDNEKEFTAVFRKDKIDFFDVYSRSNLNGKSVQSFFSDRDRIRMVAYALTQAEYGSSPDDPARCGIKRLIDQGVFLDAYPVHDGMEYSESNGLEPKSTRNHLHENWSLYKNIFKTQPLDLIKNYFGEQIGNFRYKIIHPGLYVNRFIFCISWLLYILVDIRSTARIDCEHLWISNNEFQHLH